MTLLISLTAFVTAVVVGTILTCYWAGVVFKKPRPPPTPKALDYEDVNRWIQKEYEGQEETGQVYEYIEDGMIQEARPGTEIHRLIEEVVRRE